MTVHRVLENKQTDVAAIQVKVKGWCEMTMMTDVFSWFNIRSVATQDDRMRDMIRESIRAPQGEANDRKGHEDEGNRRFCTPVTRQCPVVPGSPSPTCGS